MLTENRVIWNDNGTLRDLSAVLNTTMGGGKVIDFVAANDYLYLGSPVPFNHRYFDIQSFNAATSAVSVKIWDGDEWVSAIDVQDFTVLSSGVTMSRSGIVQWTTDKDETWAKESTTEDMTGSGLETLKIYGMYWVRLAFSGNLTSTFELNYVGHRFSNDEDLGQYYPDLNRQSVMNAFAAGKMNWNDQHILAAEDIWLYLRARRRLWSKNQVFDWQSFTKAAVHKVARIAYGPFGEEYEAKRDAAEDAFRECMDGIMDRGLDQDEDGHQDEAERVGSSIGIFRR